MFQVDYVGTGADARLVVYSIAPASEEQKEAAGDTGCLTLNIMTEEYVVPLGTLQDIFPKMSTADRVKLLYISVMMIERNRAEAMEDKASASEEQEETYLYYLMGKRGELWVVKTSRERDIQLNAGAKCYGESATLEGIEVVKMSRLSAKQGRFRYIKN